jgi:hypothetical protein
MATVIRPNDLGPTFVKKELDRVEPGWQRKTFILDLIIYGEGFIVSRGCDEKPGELCIDGQKFYSECWL